MRKQALQALALVFLVGLSGAIACDNKGGMGGCGSSQQPECKANEKWNGTQCVPR